MSSAGTVANQLCTYFGGTYEPTSHTYRSPQITVPGIDGPVFRRSPPVSDDHDTDYYTEHQQPIGCLMEVLLEHGSENRVAVAGPTSGLKHVQWICRIHAFLRSNGPFAEDLQDATYELIDAVRAHLQADRTCGSGGFEAGYGVGFQIGEGGDPWLKWVMSPVSTIRTSALSTQYVMWEFNVDQYVQA